MSQDFEVEKIIRSRMNQETQEPEYYIKWRNFPSKENTWEPAENLGGCMNLLEIFKKENEARKSRKNKKKKTPKIIKKKRSPRKSKRKSPSPTSGDDSSLHEVDNINEEENDESKEEKDESCGEEEEEENINNNTEKNEQNEEEDEDENEEEEEEDEEEQEEYEVEKIVGEELDDDGVLFYHVKWKGYKKITVEPDENIAHLENVIKKYEDSKKKEKVNKSRKRTLSKKSPKKTKQSSNTRTKRPKKRKRSDIDEEYVTEDNDNDNNSDSEFDYEAEENKRRKKRKLNDYKVDEKQFKQAKKIIRQKPFGWLEDKIRKTYKNKKYSQLNQLKSILIDIVDTYKDEDDCSVSPENDA